MLHIVGVIFAYAAGVVFILAAIFSWSSQPAGQLITWGITVILTATVALVDGARAMPSIGMWRIGAKFEGLNDLALVIIIVILVVGIGISLVF